MRHWCTTGFLVALHAASVGAQPSERCARVVLHAAALAARDVLRAQASGTDSATARMAEARQRLERRIAKATQRRLCTEPVDVGGLWDLTQQLGGDVSSVARQAGLAGTWALTGEPVAGGCADDTPDFADVLEILQQETLLDAQADFASYGGTVDGTRFDLFAVYGAIPCSGGGAYDLNLTISGERMTPSTYRVVQRYSHAAILGTCPACSVTWAGTMTRAPTAALGF